MSEQDPPEDTAAFIRVPDPRAYAAEARRQGQLVVWIPRVIRSKEKLFGIFAERLRFPDYFGWNWDALEECLSDLSWLPKEAVICLVHERSPFGEGENRNVYLEILHSAIAAGQTRSRELSAVFPT